MKPKVYKTKAVPKEERYVDFDEDTNSYAVFGTESGFCYDHGYGSENEAKTALNLWKKGY